MQVLHKIWGGCGPKKVFFLYYNIFFIKLQVYMICGGSCHTRGNLDQIRSNIQARWPYFGNLGAPENFKHLRKKSHMEVPGREFGTARPSWIRHYSTSAAACQYGKFHKFWQKNRANLVLFAQNLPKMSDNLLIFRWSLLN